MAPPRLQGEEEEWQEDAFSELVKMAVEKDPSLAARAQESLANHATSSSAKKVKAVKVTAGSVPPPVCRRSAV